MNDRSAAVERADLRDRLIPCGDFDFEESEMSDEKQHDDMRRDIRRIDTELDSHERETDRAVTELSTHYSHISATLDAQAQLLSQIDKRMGKIEVDLGRYNNMRERLDGVERAQATLGTDFVPRREFNGMVGSIRNQIKTMQWVFGIGFSLNGGLLAGLIVFLLGG